MLKHSLEVKKRDLKVKNNVYRRGGLVVANLYGEGDSQALLIEQKALSKLLPQISESTVIYLHQPHRIGPYRLYLDTRFCLTNRQTAYSAREHCEGSYKNQSNALAEFSS